jgi:hypothetical protein
MESRSGDLPKAMGRLRTQEKRTAQNRGMTFMINIITRHPTMAADRRA